MRVSLFALLLLAAPANADGKSLPAPELLAKVQAAYAKGGTIYAKFTQTVVKAAFGRRSSEHGSLWAKPDGRVRWVYNDPTPKLFVHDGQTAYFFEPQSKQVTVFQRFQDSELSEALQFLLGRGAVAKRFRIEDCKNKCDFGEPGDRVIALWPKQPIATVDHVLLVVDPKTVRVRMSILFDSQQNRSEYLFRDLQFNVTVSDDLFRFTIPKGVQKLTATLDGATAP